MIYVLILFISSIIRITFRLDMVVQYLMVETEVPLCENAAKVLRFLKGQKLL